MLALPVLRRPQVQGHCSPRPVLGAALAEGLIQQPVSSPLKEDGTPPTVLLCRMEVLPTKEHKLWDEQGTWGSTWG